MSFVGSTYECSCGVRYARPEDVRRCRNHDHHPPKTLLDAIGCWTDADDGLRNHALLVSQSVAVCRRRTRNNEAPTKLLDELTLLRKRIDSLTDMTDAAITRCRQIIETSKAQL